MDGQISLRAYQSAAVQNFRAKIAEGYRRIMLVAPTGAGKTVVGSAIIHEARKQYQNVLVLAHRREIVAQTHRKLFEHGVTAGIIQAGFSQRPSEQVQVASIQTLWARAMRSNAMELPPAHLLVIDEAHHCPAQTYRKIIEAYPTTVLLGLTATPCRGDGRGLGGLFDVIIETPQVPELIESGFLVKTRVYAPVNPDLRGVQTRQGDYVESQLADRMDRDALVGDIVTHWHKYGEQRKTVAFAVSVAHSRRITNEFIKSGVSAEHLDGATPNTEREAILARLASGETELVSNCMVLTEGWDMPEVGCCILARPTKKMGLYRQMVGRVLRPAPEKAYAIVLDHSGAVFRHGFVEDHVEWTLEPDHYAESREHKERVAAGKSSRMVECVNCGAVRLAGDICTCCGYFPKPPARDVSFQDGELGIVDRNGVQRVTYDLAERNRWHAMLIGIGRQRGYKSGWAAHKFKEKFGTFPPWGSSPAPVEPSREVLAWVRSRAVAFAKSQRSA